MPGYFIFYSPGKAVLWTKEMLGPDGEKRTTSENVLVRRRLAGDGAARVWHLFEIGEEGVQGPIELKKRSLGRVTYPALVLDETADVLPLRARLRGGS